MFHPQSFARETKTLDLRLQPKIGKLRWFAACSATAELLAHGVE